ncbi:MAG: aminopeptidase [Candidatus Latescibacteria bacterium]|nr:aminopeptidase [Candidatus Latescibacterota bacterium]
MSRPAWWCWLLLWANGCGLDYYLHLARGQARIAWRSEPIGLILASSTTSPVTAEKLRLIAELRVFARQRLGLKTGDSYTRFFDTGGQPVSWNVSASPPERFVPYLWHFPIVGDLPYKGFFSRERAARERDALQAAGLDVAMGPVSAYSTLGFFSDPVLSTMLDEEEDRLAELILHELTHATIYPPGQAEYSESAATFVGQAGALVFLAEKHGPDSPQLRQARLRQEDARRFSAFMKEAVDSLDSLYAQDLPRAEVLKLRQEVFARAKERYRSRRGEFQVDNYDAFLKWEVNNARLLSYRRYHLDLELFARVFSTWEAHPDRAISVFADCGEDPAPWDCLRRVAI